MTVKAFINKIAPTIVYFCVKNKIPYPSAIIAQALHESSLGKSPLVPYNNFWGITASKSWSGAVVKFNTWEDKNKNGKKDVGEEKQGQPWRAYSSLINGVQDYFKIITSLERYSNLKRSLSPEDYLRKIALDGWATDASYANKVTAKLKEYELDIYDIVYDTIQGKYGNGETRKKEFIKLGFDYRKVQNLVNEIIKNSYF